MARSYLWDGSMRIYPMGGSKSDKEARIERDRKLLEEKEEALAKLQQETDEDEKAGRAIDPDTENRIRILQGRIKDIKNRIDLEVERLSIISK